MVNAHTHLELTDYPIWDSQAGSTLPESFADWVLRLVKVRNAQTIVDIKKSLRSGLDQVVKAGTGAVGDILTTLNIYEVYNKSFLKGRVFLELLGHDLAKINERLGFIEGNLLRSPSGLFSLGLAPHAPYTLNSSTLSRIVSWAERHNLPLTMHLAETKDETEFLSGKTGPIAERIFPEARWNVDDFSDLPTNSPLQWLQNNKILPAGSLIAHGVHLTEAEINDIARNSWHVVLCPRSNSHFGDSRAPVATYLKAGINLALGTDSRASVSSLSLWDEIAYAWRSFPGVCDPSDWLSIATRGGAKALGLDAFMGRLEPGMGAHFQIVMSPEKTSTSKLAEALCDHAEMIEVRALYLDGENILSVN